VVRRRWSAHARMRPFLLGVLLAVADGLNSIEPDGLSQKKQAVSKV
jgi:hypothetical protein